MSIESSKLVAYPVHSVGLKLDRDYSTWLIRSRHYIVALNSLEPGKSERSKKNVLRLLKSGFQ